MALSDHGRLATTVAKLDVILGAFLDLIRIMDGSRQPGDTGVFRLRRRTFIRGPGGWIPGIWGPWILTNTAKWTLFFSEDLETYGFIDWEVDSDIAGRGRLIQWLPTSFALNQGKSRAKGFWLPRDTGAENRMRIRIPHK